LKFNQATTLSGEGNIIVKGDYTQVGNLLGKPLTLAGDSLQTISTNGTSIPALTIDKPTHATVNTNNKVVLSTPLSIAGALTLTRRNLHLADNNLTIVAGGSIAGGSSDSHIITDGTGALSQTVTSAGANFPVGGSIDSYDPVNIKPASTNVFSARVYDEPGGASGEDVSYNVAKWDIASTETGNTELKFTPLDAEHTGPYPIIGHYVGDAWVNTPATFDGTTYTATFNSFSPFTTGSSQTASSLKHIAYSFNYYVADGQLIVNGLNENDAVSVYNVSGQQVATAIAAAGQASARLDNLGVYIAVVKSNNETNTIKIVARN
jgi:hypothetical protein